MKKLTINILVMMILLAGAAGCHQPRVQEQAIANSPVNDAEISEVKASHILVKTEDEVIKIKEEIINGKDFAAAAKEYSTCPSSKDGGDLGFFKKGIMVPEFETAAFSLQPGSVSDPVKTQFGWHLIKVTEVR